MTLDRQLYHVVSLVLESMPFRTVPSVELVASVLLKSALPVDPGDLAQVKRNHLPSGNLLHNWKITIFSGKTHYKWPFSIAMLNYQRVVGMNLSRAGWKSNYLGCITLTTLQLTKWILQALGLLVVTLRHCATWAVVSQQPRFASYLATKAAGTGTWHKNVTE